MKGSMNNHGMEKNKKKRRRIDGKGQSPTTPENRCNSDPVLPDLIFEILLRLPPESVMRFARVSKFWGSIIRRPDFIDSFLTHSFTQPRFLFVLRGRDGSRLFYSSTPYETTSSDVVHTKYLNLHPGHVISHSVGGLILCESGGTRLVICNPTTGQIITLPKVRSRKKGITSFFGYDPIDHRYKVLCMTQCVAHYKSCKVAAGEHQVLTLGGAQEKSWRMIECSFPHCPATEGLCINGVLYYGACSGAEMKECFVVSFDLRSEKFDFIRIGEGYNVWLIFSTRLINYQGKLAIVEGPAYSIDLLILEDAKKHRWSRISVMRQSLRGLSLWVSGQAVINGTTHTGEIIFAPLSSRKPFCVMFYDIKRESFRSVRIDGIEDHGRNWQVCTFPDHAENIMSL
ncbi:PREDICTED: putative F-box protein At1g31000 [Tarenaya hassleriana]|uniref:putative F-box protein At1g31000 n=1 Tax=Tarenaya hassleriana TaxID=28532 RepID=UPI00053C0B3C|nr:PREDICTED: putative F-box protein At1g31000 [Tarenaya hassleriana]